MAGSNSNFQLAGTDFEQIKSNLITFLQNQNVLTDANYTGSALSVLLDILAYNTYYNANYLNLISSELFLDTASKRSAVISKAKEMGYVPKSSTSAKATVTVSVTGLQSNSLSIPKYSRFISGLNDSKTYTFITQQAYSSPVDINGNATITGIDIYEGEPVTYNYNYSVVNNPNAIFNIPDTNVDTNSLVVFVQESSTSTSTVLYNKASDYISLDGTSQVYFIQEASDGTYDVYFGDGVLGSALVDGNVVSVTYISTSGSIANGIQKFTLVNVPSTNYNFLSTTVTNAASNGSDKESIDSIKFQAPKAYSAQKRAVTKDDYIALLQQNTTGITFDAVNVWGGEENVPPIYGQVFVCIKPTGAYTLTDVQKRQLINDVLNPISLVTVQPTIVDPDYTYIVITADVLFNAKLTNNTVSDMNVIIENAIRNYSANSLNTFNSTFSVTDVGIQVKQTDPSIITSEIGITLQKKFAPDLNNSTDYILHYNTELQRGLFTSGISSSPSMTFVDAITGQSIPNVYIEEVPSATSGVQKISILNPGYSYEYVPTITISGDGYGATATATLNPITQSISSISLTNSGNNYSYAVVTITPSVYDTTGTGASAIAVLTGSNGTLRSYYYNNQNNKTILNPNVGTVDYNNGIVYLTSFGPTQIDNPLGQLTITATPKSTILTSNFNTIITIDSYDPNAVIVNSSSK